MIFPNNIYETKISTKIEESEFDSNQTWREGYHQANLLQNHLDFEITDRHNKKK